MSEESIFSQFRRNRDERPDAAAFLIAAGDRAVSISWRQFARDIETIAWLICHHTPGAAVGLLGENSYEWMTAHAAGLFTSVTVVPLETNLTAAEIAERLAFTGARALIHSALYVDKAREVERLLPGLIVGGFGSRKADEMLALARAALDAGEPGVFDMPPRNEDETAMIVFTSGTTSKPRGAELTLRGIRTFSEFCSSMLPMEPGDRSLMLLPLHHIFGICTTYMMLAKGVALGVCPDFRRIYDAVERFRARFLFLVPALAEILASKIAQRGRSAEEALGTPVDWILVGGAPLARRTYEHLMSLGIRPLGGYGLTETTSLYSIAPVGEPRPGSAGKSCGGFGGMETKVREDGALLIRGPAVLKGYYKEPARTNEAVDADGWLNTGDIGRIDEDGFVWITGRASRTIILSSGKKVAPEELEEKILAIPGIHEVVVSGDGATRELKAEVYAVVSEETVKRQINALNKQLPVHKRIRAVAVRKEPFPRTSSGKIKVEHVQQAPQVESFTDAPPGNAPYMPTGGPQDNAARSTSRRNRFLGWFAVMAALAVVTNLAKLVLIRSGAQLPQGVRCLVGYFEDFGDILLGIFILLAILAVRRAGMFHSERKKRK